MTWLLLYPLLRPLVRWAALLALLVTADALLRILLRHLVAAYVDPFLPRPAAAVLALTLLGAAVFLAAAIREWRATRLYGPAARSATQAERAKRAEQARRTGHCVTESPGGAGQLAVRPAAALPEPQGHGAAPLVGSGTWQLVDESGRPVPAACSGSYHIDPT